MSRKLRGGSSGPLVSGFGPNAEAIFSDHKDDDIHPQMIKMARKSGQLNLSGQNRTQIPFKVFCLNELAPEETKKIDYSMDKVGGGDEEKWWDRVDLSKLILSSNIIAEIQPEIKDLISLTLLDLSDNRLVALPDEIGELKFLQKLMLSRNDLRTLPESIGKLDDLRVLSVSHNNLSSLSSAIGSLYVVEEINVSHNALTTLPASIGYLQRLSNLNLSDNKLTNLPVEMGDMFGLVHLDVSRNLLPSLIESLGNLPKLEVLSLRQNRIETFPVLGCQSLKEIYLGENKIKLLEEKHFVGIPGLTILDLGDNYLDELPDEITLLQKLQRLEVSNNSLSTIPCHLGFLSHLKSLGLSGNTLKLIRRDIIQRGTQPLLQHLAQKAPHPIGFYPGFDGCVERVVDEGPPIPDQFEMRQSGVMAYHEKLGTVPEQLFENAKSSQVRSADLTDNILKQVPEIIGILSPFLQELNLSNNLLTSLPTVLGAFKYLQYINVQNNRLTELPKEFEKVKTLREVNISFNKFTNVPDCLYECESLEILMACDNKIESIDVDNLSKLLRLATIDLRNNNIGFVPPALGRLEQIRSLQLEGNGFRVPRIAIMQKGTRELMEYLRSRIVDG